MSTSSKAILWIIILIIIIGAIWYGVSRRSTEKPIKIGLLIPLTGSNASIGDDIKNAALLALEDQLVNLENVEIQIVIQDSKCEPAEGVTGFKKLVEVDEVVAVVGITCSGVAKAIGPIAEEKGVPTLLSVAASYKPEENNGWVFKFWPSNEERASFEAKLMAEKLKVKKVAVIYENNAFGVGLKEEFEKKVGELGNEIVISESYNPGTVDFRSNLIKIKDSDPEVIFVIAYEDSAVNILKQARELDINKKAMTTSAVISESFLISIGEIGEGLIVDLPITRSDLTDEFENKFAEKFNDRIIHPGGYFVYDSIVILTEILTRVQEKEEVKNYLYQVDTTGVSGRIEFDEFGKNKKKEEFGALIIQDGQFVPYEE